MEPGLQKFALVVWLLFGTCDMHRGKQATENWIFRASRRKSDKVGVVER